MAGRSREEAACLAGRPGSWRGVGNRAVRTGCESGLEAWAAVADRPISTQSGPMAKGQERQIAHTGRHAFWPHWNVNRGKARQRSGGPSSFPGHERELDRCTEYAKIDNPIA
jgi:hypothetical protein